MDKVAAALKHVRRYRDLDLALDVAARQVYNVPVLLGDDGRFWVPGTRSEAAILIAAGYDEAYS